MKAVSCASGVFGLNPKRYVVFAGNAWRGNFGLIGATTRGFSLSHAGLSAVYRCPQSRCNKNGGSSIAWHVVHTAGYWPTNRTPSTTRLSPLSLSELGTMRRTSSMPLRWRYRLGGARSTLCSIAMTYNSSVLRDNGNTSVIDMCWVLSRWFIPIDRTQTLQVCRYKPSA